MVLRKKSQKIVSDAAKNNKMTRKKGMVGMYHPFLPLSPLLEENSIHVIPTSTAFLTYFLPELKLH